MPTSAASVQLVLYTEPAATRSSLALWTKMFKSEPLGFQTLQNGVSQSNGIEGGYSVILQAQSARIDLIVSGNPIELEMPRIDDLNAAALFGIKALERGAPVNVNRAALVVQRTIRHGTVEEAVEAIKAAVPGLDAPQGAVDIWYQTAVKRPSREIPGGMINLMRRWNTGVTKLIQLSMSPQPSLSVGGPSMVVSMDYVDLSLVEPQKLFPKKATALLVELVERAEGLLSDGYASLI